MSRSRKGKISSDFDPKEYVRPNANERMIMDMKAAFDFMDTNKNGTIEMRELRKALESAGLDSNPRTVRRLLQECDENSDGVLQFGEFVELMSGHILGLQQEADLKKIFQEFAGERESIDVDTLREVAKEMDPSITESELKRMIKTADKDGDGVIMFDDFKSLFVASEQSLGAQKSEEFETEAPKKPKRNQRRLQENVKRRRRGNKTKIRKSI